MNQYPAWKYILIVVVMIFGFLYALPNLYEADPAVQVSAMRGELSDTVKGQIEARLSEKKIPVKSIEFDKRRLLVRFGNTEEQLAAADQIKDVLGPDYAVALNLAPSTPAWLQAINAQPMYLGLDLRGGVHFLMEVDMDAALQKALERYSSDLRTLLRKDKIRYLSIRPQAEVLQVKFRSAEDREKGRELIHGEFSDLELKDVNDGKAFALEIRVSESEVREIRKLALQQNITTLRNRVNELGVAEPVIQQQGDRRVVVQLPGVQDTVAAKRIIGATATLEYRAVDTEHDVEDAINGKVPAGSKLYKDRDGRYHLLKNRIIVTGDQIINARSGFDSQGGQPQVTVTLDGKGARKMLEFTKANVGKPMAVVFIENKSTTRMVDGNPEVVNRKVEEIISIATIRDVFSKRFQTTGLDSPQEAHELALLLRSGALAAPIRIIEERTIGPSLGADNIKQGFTSVVIGFVLVLVFMAVYYKVFGLVADLALAMNLVLIIAILSMLQATLTMPGIAGIVLTVGMAVDANVLIFERIREELRNGNTPQASIHAGYAKAFSTIADANVTTLIAAIVLFSFGSGPVKGFAVTLSIGILTSMFTAIMGTRAVINLAYGGRRLQRLPI
ncbi:preprotein translocase subunit SecD [Thiogranum longum]|uniref:Protein translocase subunit SecD n=1 Tax=Thiogranum longum TaxID=1537524 RepID=A0A4R1HHD2_9GAMM|nr:protein translocase subunit SecD [Thiogranum longum]TCK18799.1 preprotein translocase subunit SecD [Thiogranum longum]